MTLFAYGFRPFFLLAAAFAVLQMPLWILELWQIVPSTGGVAWHAHELIYGFVAAVIAGFLLTAARNWTGRNTASGAALAGLCALWVAGRVAVTAASALPAWLVAGVDAAFLPALAFFVARPIVHAKQWRQLGILVVLGALTASNVVFHAAPTLRRTAWLTGLDLVLALIVIIGGRVIPMFTHNALPDANVRSRQPIERLSAISMLALIILEIAGHPGLACLAAGAVQAVRLSGWASHRTGRSPILWVLHVGYAWLALGLVLRGLALYRALLPEPAAIHVLTAGAIGALVLGMMARVASGHTGRPMKAPPLAVFAFVLLTIAVPLRAFLPTLAPSNAGVWYALAGAAWTLAFAAYLIRYAAWLVGPRADGRPG